MCMTIVPYDSKYFKNCIKIIQSNTPKYIDYSEHSDYEDYLLRDDKIYFVLFKKSNIAACGGYGINKSGTKVGLSWGLVHSQHTYRFFEKFGFIVKQISKNGFGEGLDKYDMILK